MAEITSKFTQAHLDALTTAIAQGVQSVSVDGRTVNYASIADMQRLRDRMIRELKERSDGVTRPVARLSVFKR